MINLLPPTEKEILLLEKRQRLVMVLGSVALMFLIFLILILLSVKFYILAEANYQDEILAAEKNKYQTPDFLFFKDIIQKYNSSLALADTFYKKETRMSDALEIISELEKPKGLYLTNVAVEKNGQGNTMMATISGVSNNRNSLTLFKDSIDQNKNIKNTYFPASNWIKPADFTFYLTFEVVPVKELTNSPVDESQK